jgi:soluble lytic murein transglycosylase
MHRKALLLALLGASVTGIASATLQPPMLVTRAPIAPKIIKETGPKLAMAPAAQSYAPAPRPAVSSAIASDIARWNALRQSDNQPFSSYASFLANNRGWPGETAMRRAAERQIRPEGASPGEVVRFFSIQPPLTATGHAHHALALQASGRGADAQAAARRAWTMGALPSEVESRLLGAFGPGFSQADHDERADALLSNGDTQSALRMLPLTSAARRPVYEARLALQTRAADARSRVMSLGPEAAGDPGLLIDRANYLRNTGNPLDARQLLAQRRTLASQPKNPAKFMESMVTMARAAANDRQWELAYRIASQVDDIFPAGTNVSLRSFDERDEYTNLTWLAGTTALQRLNRPSDAVGMFERYGRAAQSPQTRTKGLYWAGRASQAAGQSAQAQTYWREASREYDQFYGQLSSERIGVPLAAPAQTVPEPSIAERQAFNSLPIVAAARYLGQTGNWRDQSEFVRAIATQADDDRERALAIQLGREIGRQDLPVLVSRASRNAGSFAFVRPGFPEVRVPGAQAHHWSVIHGITRQESLFDREALSSAGARGLMQLMPGTAREVAGRAGLPYDQGRLTRDPEYNVMLGSAYFARLLDQYGGSYPLAVASYNAGPGNVNRWLRENGDPRTPGINMVDWIEKIPFFETRNYVQRVLENAVVYDLMNPGRSRSGASPRVSFYLGERAD